ncbi:MAG: acyl-CoA carboxylase epsilon subunit [Phycicoccus sp.]
MLSRGEVGSAQEETSVIRVSGGATAEDVAAVLAVLAALSDTHGDLPDDERGPVGALRSAGRWGGPRAAIRHPIDHAPGAWRRAFRT